MKQILLLVLLVLVTEAAFTQNNIHSTLDKAESQYQKGEYNKALRTLNRRTSKSQRSGSMCGNAALDYRRNINMLKANIYMNQKEYENARSALNSISLSSYNDNIDSLIIVTYQLEFGKDSLSNMFDSTLTNATVKCNASECFVALTLSKGNQMEFKIPSLRYTMTLGQESTEDELLNMWINEFRKSKNFELIQGKS